MNDNDKRNKNIMKPGKPVKSRNPAGKGTGVKSAGNNHAGAKGAGSKGTGSKGTGSKSTGSKSTGSKSTGSRRAKSVEAGNPKSSAGGSGMKKNTGSEEERRKKIRNSNLRLVKNGDMPVDETPARKSSKKRAVSKKETAPGEETAAKKEAGLKKGTALEEETASGKETNSEGQMSSGKETNSEGQMSSEKETNSEGQMSSEKEKASKKETASEKGKSQKKETASKKEKASKNKAVSKKEAGKEKKKRRVRKEAYFEDRPGLGEWFVQHRSLVIIGLTVFAVIALIASLYYYVVTRYEVTTVYVDGNIHYTNEEVMNMVMNGRYGNNSLYLSMKYKDQGVEGVPFVEKMDVSILSPDTIRINVYEKAIAGYVEYLGQYMYFDKDGIIVESSGVRTKGVPLVTGLNFDYVVMHEPLPVENDKIFKQILSITQLLEKYKLNADKIFFDSVYDMTLYFGGVRVTIGAEDQVDEKLMKLPSILPELEGKSGMLHYMEDGKSISFNQDS